MIFNKQYKLIHNYNYIFNKQYKIKNNTYAYTEYTHAYTFVINKSVLLT